MCIIGVDDGEDIQHLFLEAKNRWLEPSEVCEILQNHKKLPIHAQRVHRPSSGSLYLFNRKALKRFRKDGHNWKKKNDGKAVTEGNQKLKAGSRELHCYYAWGEENENFKRRSYRILEKEPSNIVLVHYLEEKRKRECWSTVKIENEVYNSSFPLPGCSDSYTPGPSPSHDLLFSILDFAPDWAYENSQTKVLITGRFLKGQHAESCKWSCMFGEVEVPAEVMADGVLRCYSPVHKAGRLPFYVTCSNRPGLACSEEKTFEFRPKHYYSNYSTEALNKRFEKLLSSSSTSPNCDPTSIAENSELLGKISSLLTNDNDQGDNILQCLSDENISWEAVNQQSLQPLKKMLHAWLWQKGAAGGKGPSVLDEGGLGVLHFAAALGYDWVLFPTIDAGVSVDFRDVNGWTALHWAAFYGRENMVPSLISLGADPEALTNTGETPQDLAFDQSHFGIEQQLKSSCNHPLVLSTF